MTKTDETVLQRAATDALRHFETATRATSGEKFWRTRTGAPGWLRDLVHTAHGDLLPDDWRYAFIVEALNALAENADPEDIQLEADTYTHDLLAWVGSNLLRTGYCDEALEEWGGDAKSLAALLGLGQVKEKEEVLAAVRAGLEAHLDLEEQQDNPELEP